MQIDYQNLLANIEDGVYFTDTERTIIYWNKSAERITGYGAQEVVGRKCRDNILIHIDQEGCSLCKGRCPMAAAMKDGLSREARVFLHHKKGHRVPVHIRATPLTDSHGHVVGAAEFFTDISTEETLQMRIQELEKVALLDALTELPNRHHIEPELSSRFHEMERMGLNFGLTFMDIDHFKMFNDTHGHDVGDEVLRVVAKTLKVSVRPFDLVGRWGGEEFMCIVRGVQKDQLQVISQRLRMLISQSVIHTEKQRLNVTVSIGATMASPNDNMDSLIKRADKLMYTSKASGRNKVTLG